MNTTLIFSALLIVMVCWIVWDITKYFLYRKYEEIRENQREKKLEEIQKGLEDLLKYMEECVDKNKKDIK